MIDETILQNGTILYTIGKDHTKTKPNKQAYMIILTHLQQRA